MMLYVGVGIAALAIVAFYAYLVLTAKPDPYEHEGVIEPELPEAQEQEEMARRVGKPVPA